MHVVGRSLEGLTPRSDHQMAGVGVSRSPMRTPPSVTLMIDCTLPGQVLKCLPTRRRLGYLPPLPNTRVPMQIISSGNNPGLPSTAQAR